VPTLYHTQHDEHHQPPNNEKITSQVLFVVVSGDVLANQRTPFWGGVRVSTHAHMFHRSPPQNARSLSPDDCPQWTVTPRTFFQVKEYCNAAYGGNLARMLHTFENKEVVERLSGSYNMRKTICPTVQRASDKVVSHC